MCQSAQELARCKNILLTVSKVTSVTRLDILLDFGQLFKAFGNN